MEEQYINPEILNQLNNNSQNDDINADFGLEGFFDDNKHDDEISRNRDSVFDMLDSAQNDNTENEQKKYNEQFNEDCKTLIGCAPRRTPNGSVIPVKPNFFETMHLKQRYNAVGSALLIFILLSMVIPYILIYAGVFGMIFKSGGNFNNITQLDMLVSKVTNSTGGYMLVNAGTVLVSLFIATWFGCKSAVIDIKDFFARPKINAGKTLAYTSVLFFVQLAANIVITTISMLVSQGGNELYTADFSTKTDPFATIVICTYTIIIAPFAEELFFRGFILNNVSKISRTFAMFLSSFLFGIYHMNIPQFVSATLFGLLLSYVTLKADSIIPAIIIHAINNCVSMVLTILTEYNQSLGETVSVIAMYGLAAIGLLSFVLLSRKEGFPLYTIYEKYRSMPIAIKSAPLIISVIIMIAMTAAVMFV